MGLIKYLFGYHGPNLWVFGHYSPFIYAVATDGPYNILLEHKT